MFTVIDMDTHRRMGLEEMEKLCGMLGLQHVPIEEKEKDTLCALMLQGIFFAATDVFSVCV